MYFTDDTIIAVASAAGGAARGIVRLSGPLAFEIVTRFSRDATNQHVLLPRAGSHHAGPKPASAALVVTLQLPGLTASATVRSLRLARGAKLYGTTGRRDSYLGLTAFAGRRAGNSLRDRRPTGRAGRVHSADRSSPDESILPKPKPCSG